MDEEMIEVNRRIIELSEQFGEVIPRAELYRILSELGKSKIDAALKRLEEEGMVSFIDRDAVSLNQ